MIQEATKKKDHSFLYIASTISFVIAGIILTSIINKTKSSTDIRSRASAQDGVAASAVIAEINYDNNTVVVNQLTFSSSPNKNMGSFIVTLPENTDINTFASGGNVKLTIDASTLNITKHTLTAKEIRKK